MRGEIKLRELQIVFSEENWEEKRRELGRVKKRREHFTLHQWVGPNFYTIKLDVRVRVGEVCPNDYNVTFGEGLLGLPKVLTQFLYLTDIFFRQTMQSWSLTNISILVDISAEVALDVDATSFATCVWCLVCTLVSCSAIHNLFQKFSLFFANIGDIVW